MPNYLLSYHGGGGMETDEAEMQKVMAAWGAWFGQLGDAIVDGGNPTAQCQTVASDGSVSEGGGANPVTGYSVIKADDLAAATTAAKGCPILGSGGSVEVAELIDTAGM